MNNANIKEDSTTPEKLWRLWSVVWILAGLIVITTIQLSTGVMSKQHTAIALLLTFGLPLIAGVIIRATFSSQHRA